MYQYLNPFCRFSVEQMSEMLALSSLEYTPKHADRVSIGDIVSVQQDGMLPFYAKIVRLPDENVETRYYSQVLAISSVGKEMHVHVSAYNLVPLQQALREMQAELGSL